MLDGYLKTKEIAEMLNLTEATIRTYISTGRFPKPDVQLFKRNYWKKETIETWLTKQIKEKQKND